MTEERSAGELLDEARRWWTTSIIDIHPGEIAVRGYPIEQLIGNVTFPQMIWLMLMGELPTEPQATLLEAALVAGVDHGPQAPSIAISRMAATCGPSLNGAMASAINVLDDIHGGPGEQCMEIYYEINALAGAGGDLIDLDRGQRRGVGRVGDGDAGRVGGRGRGPRGVLGLVGLDVGDLGVVDHEAVERPGAGAGGGQS